MNSDTTLVVIIKEPSLTSQPKKAPVYLYYVVLGYNNIYNTDTYEP